MRGRLASSSPRGSVAAVKRGSSLLGDGGSQWEVDPEIAAFRDAVKSLQKAFPQFDVEELEEIYAVFMDNASGPDSQHELARVSGNQVGPMLVSLHYYFDRTAIKSAILYATSQRSDPGSPMGASTVEPGSPSRGSHVPPAYPGLSGPLSAFHSTTGPATCAPASHSPSNGPSNWPSKGPQRLTPIEGSHHSSEGPATLSNVGSPSQRYCDDDRLQPISRESSGERFTANSQREDAGPEHRNLEPPPSSHSYKFGKLLMGSTKAAGASSGSFLNRVSSFANANANSNGRKRVKSTEWQISLHQFVLVIHQLRTGHHTDQEVMVTRHFPFDPDSGPKQSWDLFIMALLLYTTFSIPFLLAFEKEFTTPLDAFNTFELVVDVIFCADIMVNFGTAYTDRGIYITDLTQIARHYVKSWFLIDFMGSIPFDKIAYFVIASNSDASDLGAMGAMRILKIIRVLKMLRAIRLLDKLNQLEQKDGFTFLRTFIRIFRSVFLLVFVAHFAGCIFVMLLKQNTAWNWLKAYDEELLDEGDFTQYTVALYWAIISVSTMGYGDILPVTHEERIFAVFVAVVGTVVFSICMGNLTSLVAQSTGMLWRFENKLRHVNEWLEWRKFPVPIKRRVRDYYGACWRVSSELYYEQEIIAELPKETRKMLVPELAQQALEQLPFLDGLSDECKMDVFLATTSVRFNQKDFVYQRLDEGSDLFVLISGVLSSKNPVDLFLGMPSQTTSRNSTGNVSYTSQADQPTESEQLEASSMFGEIALFPDICKYRTETVVAETVCNCYKLPLAAFQQLAVTYPELEKKLRTLCTLKAHYLGVNNEAMEALKAQQREEGGFGYLDAEARKLRAKIATRQQERLRQLAGVTEKDRVFTVWWPRDLLQGLHLGAENEKRRWVKVQVAASQEGKVFARVAHADDITKQLAFHVGDVQPGFKCKKRVPHDHDHFTLGTAVVELEVALRTLAPAGATFSRASSASPVARTASSPIRSASFESSRGCDEGFLRPSRKIVVGLRDKDTAQEFLLALKGGEEETSPGVDITADRSAGRGVSGMTPCTQLREELEESLNNGRAAALPAAYPMSINSGSETNDAARGADGPAAEQHEADAGAPQAGPRVQGQVPAREPAGESVESQPMEVCGAMVQVAGAFGAPTANMGALERLDAMEIAPPAPSAAPIRPPADERTPALQVGADAPWIQAGEIEIEETAAAARAEAADAEETDVSDVGWT